MFWTRGQAKIFQYIYDKILKESKNVNFDLLLKNSIDNYHKKVDGTVYTANIYIDFTIEML